MPHMSTTKNINIYACVFLFMTKDNRMLHIKQSRQKWKIIISYSIVVIVAFGGGI